MKITDKERITHLYIVEHLTLREIAAIHNVSATCIHKILKKSGIQSKQGTWVDTFCTFCHSPLSISRSIFKKRQNHFCNQSCHIKFKSQSPLRQFVNRWYPPTPLSAV